MKSYRIQINDFGSDKPRSYIDIFAVNDTAAEEMMRAMFGVEAWWVSVIEVTDAPSSCELCGSGHLSIDPVERLVHCYGCDESYPMEDHVNE